MGEQLKILANALKGQFMISRDALGPELLRLPNERSMESFDSRATTAAFMQLVQPVSIPVPYPHLCPQKFLPARMLSCRGVAGGIMCA